MRYQNRVLVSFDGICPMKCKHCYTYELNLASKNRSIDQIVLDLNDKKFDVIYLSQSYENFFDEKKGIELVRKLYDCYQKDIFIITRSYLTDYSILELVKISHKMKEKGNKLILAVSICGDKSYGRTENIDVCPTPELRLSNLERAYKAGIQTILLLRPIFPDNVIPIQECIDVIQKAHNYVCSVISSGLIVTDEIISRLNLRKDNLKILSHGNSEYLDNLDREKVKYLDVSKELDLIRGKCELLNLPFFSHSMPALNYLATAYEAQ